MPALDRIERIIGSRITQVERIEPWFVLRVYLTDGSVIVKWLRDTPGDVRTGADQLIRERAGLEFVAQLDPGLAPRLLAADIPAADPSHGFLVIEDFASFEPLRAVILRDGVDRAPLASYARALARLHGATVGKRAVYSRHLRRLGLPELPPAHYLRQWSDGVSRMREFGAPMSSAAEQELAGVVADFAHPGPFLTLSNGDAQQNNYLVDGADGRLIDFEGATYQHCLADVVHLYVPGSMWLTVNDPTTNGLETAYRKELAPAIPEADDDRLFGLGISGVSLLSAIERLVSLPKLELRAPGNTSRLHRVATLEAAARTAERHRCLPHLAGWAWVAAAALRRRWPDADVDLAALGPYASR
jgi:hypothetical protein